MWVGSPLLLLMLMCQVGVAGSIHHPGLWRSTTGWGCHSLPLLAFLMGVDRIIHDDSIADKLQKSSASVERKALL
jgi:hypothetical protein